MTKHCSLTIHCYTDIMALINEIATYLPKCIILSDNRYSLSSPNKYNKKILDGNQIKSLITSAKIEIVFSKYKNSATKVVRSVSTKSIYFNYRGNMYRISNHKKANSNRRCIQIIIKWDSDIEELCKQARLNNTLHH